MLGEATLRAALRYEPDDVDGWLMQRGYVRVVGVDEVGRGPLAGPVVVAAVLWPVEVHAPLVGVRDSKGIAEGERRIMAGHIRSLCTHVIVSVEADDIARMNILQATLYGMREAIRLLRAQEALASGIPVLVDGTHLPDPCDPWSVALVRGDARSRAVGAASVLAKVHRDQRMAQEDAHYPGYGFGQHKGYGTALHRAALQRLGPTPLHRRGFRPVDEAYAQWCLEGDGGQAPLPLEASCPKDSRSLDGCTQRRVRKHGSARRP